mmetsp:Transcript_1939/g.2359  ORF Transcript_1939/g.2359 Transcript_1939/m.2359 type:complete len:453 (+) Transcript_1939:89-1447(+)
MAVTNTLNDSNNDKSQRSKDLSEIINPTSAPIFNLLQEAPLPPSSSSITSNPHIPSVSASAVLGESYSMPEGTPIVRGFDFSSVANNSTSSSDTLDGILRSYATMGFQASNIALAIDQINEMRKWRLSDVPYQSNEDESLKDMDLRKKIRARIFFSYTSNQISCGQREIIRYLVQHKMVDVIVTTAGGIEEDLMKCFEHTYMGDFKLSGRELRKKGINRIGNLLVPNKNYCKFEDWMSPLITKMHDEQDSNHVKWAQEVAAASSVSSNKELPEKFVWTPSKMIKMLGQEINDESSVLYWAAKNDIPIFCPAITDGSVGDMLYFHSYKRKGFIVDINEDIRKINDIAVQSHATGQIIIGGGLVKHHTCNANLMRNGANYSVYVNTGQEFDGSDSGASPDEAISWGKIRIDAKPVKVSCDATIALPLIVSQTFAKNVEAWKKESEELKCWYGDE